MDELCIDDRARGCARLHERDEDVDQLAGLRADDGRADDALGLRIDQDFHDARGLVDLDGARDVPEGQGGDFEGDALLARLSLGQSDACDLGVGEDRVRNKAAAAAPVRAPQQDVEEQPVVVPAGVRELRATDHVADGVDAGRAGPILVVGDDDPFFIELDSCSFAAEIVGVRAAARCDQKMRAAHLLAAGQPEADLSRAARDACRFRAQLEVDALPAEDFLERRRDLGILPRQQVLVESRHKDKWRGRTPTNKLVFFEDGTSERVGQLVDIDIVEHAAWSMQGVAASVPLPDD